MMGRLQVPVEVRAEADPSSRWCADASTRNPDDCEPIVAELWLGARDVVPLPNVDIRVERASVPARVACRPPEGPATSGPLLMGEGRDDRPEGRPRGRPLTEHQRSGRISERHRPVHAPAGGRSSRAVLQGRKVPPLERGDLDSYVQGRVVRPVVDDIRAASGWAHGRLAKCPASALSDRSASFLRAVGRFVIERSTRLALRSRRPLSERPRRCGCWRSSSVRRMVAARGWRLPTARFCSATRRSGLKSIPGYAHAPARSTPRFFGGTSCRSSAECSSDA